MKYAFCQYPHLYCRQTCLSKAQGRWIHCRHSSGTRISRNREHPSWVTSTQRWPHPRRLRPRYSSPQHHMFKLFTPSKDEDPPYGKKLLACNACRVLRDYSKVFPRCLRQRRDRSDPARRRSELQEEGLHWLDSVAYGCKLGLHQICETSSHGAGRSKHESKRWSHPASFCNFKIPKWWNCYSITAPVSRRKMLTGRLRFI